MTNQTTSTSTPFRAEMSTETYMLQIFYINMLVVFGNNCKKRIEGVSELLNVIPFKNGVLLEVEDVYGAIRYLVVVRQMYKDHEGSDKEDFVVLSLRDIVGGRNSSYFVSSMKGKVIISILGGRDDYGCPLDNSYKVYVGENGVYVERLKPTNTVSGKIFQNKKNKTMYLSNPYTYNAATDIWEKVDYILSYDISSMRFLGIRE